MSQEKSIDIPAELITTLMDLPTKVIDPTFQNIPETSDFSTPIWIRTLDNQFCGAIADSNDYHLVHLMTQKRIKEGKPILFQQGAKGKTYYLIGFRMAYHFLPVEIFDVEFTSGNYRIPRLIWLPTDCSGLELKKIVEKAKTIAPNLPTGYYGVLLEFVVDTQKIHLSFIHTFSQPDEVMTQVCKLASGMDLQEISDTVEKQGIPTAAPTHELGCAAAWIIPNSGIVQDIHGIEKVQALEGIKQVNIEIKIDDKLNHIVDIPSRNKVGYVIAVGPDSFIAKNRALSAISQIQIKTQNIIL
ncbi:MAG TPA: hypothetical protein PLX23_00270 [Candidatus Hydrogenedens sp.]|nr:hypothetical protein [Candidatus Hydrogenedens sp.]